jgi:hypothetical protein
LGIDVLAGMVFASLICFFLIPSFYVMLQRMSERHSPFRREPAAPTPGAAPARSPSAPDR